MKKNVILAAATHYGWHELEPFFVSMNKNAGDVDCVIFYDDLSDWTMDSVKSTSTQGGGY